MVPASSAEQRDQVSESGPRTIVPPLLGSDLHRSLMHVSRRWALAFNRVDVTFPKMGPTMRSHPRCNNKLVYQFPKAYKNEVLSRKKRSQASQKTNNTGLKLTMFPIDKGNSLFQKGSRRIISPQQKA